jgi:hypothetical protein
MHGDNRDRLSKRNPSLVRAGQYFLVPVSPSEYVVGLALRKKARGMIAVFFGEIVGTGISIEALRNYEASSALWYGIVSTLGIDTGFWLLLDGPPFDKDRWHLPWFAQVVGGSPERVRYDKDPFEPVETVSCDMAELEGMPENGVNGFLVAAYKVETVLGLPFYPEKTGCLSIQGVPGMERADEFLANVTRELKSGVGRTTVAFYVYAGDRDAQAMLDNRLRDAGFDAGDGTRTAPPYVTIARRQLSLTRTALLETDAFITKAAGETSTAYAYYEVSL